MMKGGDHGLANQLIGVTPINVMELLHIYVWIS